VQAVQLANKFCGSPLASILLSGFQGNGEEPTQPAPNGPIYFDNTISISFIERSLKRAAISEMDRLEYGLSWLASVATASPFIGLLGTVIGIILAFQGLSRQSESSIQSVAPGIAEALVATAFGLFAAIPAYIAYNQYVNQVKGLGGAMEEFAYELLNWIERSRNHYVIEKP
jgi:biopolymer transport protein TolQ